MNIPYVKRYDSNGTLLNPINGKYANVFPNRSARKSEKVRSFKNRNTKTQNVFKTSRYGVEKQFIKVVKILGGFTKVSFKPIVHYRLKQQVK